MYLYFKDILTRQFTNNPKHRKTKPKKFIHRRWYYSDLLNNRCVGKYQRRKTREMRERKGFEEPSLNVSLTHS